MASHLIHLAVGSLQSKSLNIINTKEYNLGLVAPDLLKNKEKELGGNGLISHFGFSNNPDINAFLKLFEKEIETNDYYKGYLVHLLTDYMYYNHHLEKWYKEIYDDYDKINNKLLLYYNLEIFSEIKNHINFSKGITKGISFESESKFINEIGNTQIKKLIKIYQDNN